ncbi:hypothetical protein [Sporomusa paucivorans]|uniref:hypothetical protein n=1 Tax=Sporomusa paucivorans TaxID=2376 RepID=UPI003570A8D0
MDLSIVPTYKLLDEVRKRHGSMTTYHVKPNESYLASIQITGHTEHLIQGKGLALIMVMQDHTRHRAVDKGND